MFEKMKGLRWWGRPVSIFLDGLTFKEGPRVYGNRVVRLPCGHLLDIPVLHVPHDWSVMEKILRETWLAESCFLMLHKPILFLDLEEAGMSIEDQQELFFQTARGCNANTLAVQSEALMDEDQWVVDMARQILSSDKVFTEQYFNMLVATKATHKRKPEYTERCARCHPLIPRWTSFFS